MRAAKLKKMISPKASGKIINSPSLTLKINSISLKGLRILKKLVKIKISFLKRLNEIILILKIMKINTLKTL